MTECLPPRKLLFALTLGFLAGCKSEGFTSAEVTGTVTVGGKPAAGLMVQFEPGDAAGKKLPPGTGLTNAEGKYVLLRPGGKSGAVVGKNTVRVMNGEGGELGRLRGKAVEGTVSQHEVKPGSNVIDIALTLK